MKLSLWKELIDCLKKLNKLNQFLTYECTQRNENITQGLYMNAHSIIFYSGP